MAKLLKLYEIANYRMLITPQIQERIENYIKQLESEGYTDIDILGLSMPNRTFARMILQVKCNPPVEKEKPSDEPIKQEPIPMKPKPKKPDEDDIIEPFGSMPKVNTYIVTQAEDIKKMIKKPKGV